MPDPLFLSSRAELLRRLRLSGACQDGAVAQIDQAIEKTRVWFYDEVEGVGPTRVAELLAIPYVENATDTTSLQRTMANLVEVEKVRCCLLHTMPLLFMDASGVRQEAWNEEPFVREDSSRVAEMIKACETEIACRLPALKGEPCDQGILNVSVFGPDCPQPKPGDSLRPFGWQQAGGWPFA